MSAPLSLRDKQYAFLVGIYGPGLSYVDMLTKYLGNGNTSLSDLQNAAYPGPGSLTDDYNTALGGSGSLSDKQYADPSGGVSTTVVNLLTNPTPGSATSWATTDGANFSHAFVGGAIEVNKTTGPSTRSASVGATGIVSPIQLTAGVRYQRSVEVWVDTPATIVNITVDGYVGGQVIPANVWTKVTEYFTAVASTRHYARFAVDTASIGTGVHVKLRRGFLAENPDTSRELAYADGNSPSWSWSGAANASTSSGPPIYEENPALLGPAPIHAFWAGAQTATDGDLITNWSNSGGGSGAALSNTGGATRPTYKASDPTLGNKSSMLFNGSHFLSTDVADVAQPYYAVCIASGNTWGRGSVGVGASTNGTAGIGVRTSNGNWFVCAGTVLDSLFLASAVNPALVVGKYSGASSEIQVNNAAPVVGNAGAEIMSYFKAGCMGLVATNGAFWAGSINFAAVYATDPRLDPKWSKILDYAKSCGVPIT